MNDIILTTLNARYIHSAFGLRYLYANLGELQPRAQLIEFNINQRPIDIAEQLLACRPRIIGFGVYIWNVTEIATTLAILKQVAPDLIVILGGPEVSHPPDLPALTEYADFIITGPGEISFAELCHALLLDKPPPSRIIKGQSAPLSALASPYAYYDDLDIRQRIIYVEASRGCPFKCEFCLSALDTTAKPFPLEAFLLDMASLYDRGARHFKFIDRTFNLKVETSVAILEFFLDRLSEDLYLHFEVIPDNLPDRLKDAIQRFPPGVLQFEIGIQSFDPTVQHLISRRQDHDKTIANLQWLREHSHAHIHADLIAGLPGDTLEGFGASFDQLAALKPQEIQVGILKRLRGAPINRHNDAYHLRYDPLPPYQILCTDRISFSDMQRLNRFARFWDLIGNSGRFSSSLGLILSDQPFARFMRLTDALYALTGSTWKIALKRLFELNFKVMIEALDIDVDIARMSLEEDFSRSGEKGRLEFSQQSAIANRKQRIANKRQQHYLPESS
ncbi:MAG: hypothetical protein RL563_522 [Pseudomonadota bacterium]